MRNTQSSSEESDTLNRLDEADGENLSTVILSIKYLNADIIGIIPAREGSKGISRKNIKDLNVVPLIA
jgi:hypothetical protein